MEVIGNGAEAIVYHDDGKVLKKRISKSYRIKEIDNKLISFRTSREYNVLKKLKDFSFVPRVFSKKDATISMEYISGKRLRDVIDENNFKSILNEVSNIISSIHNNHIIHGDLTTSNFVYEDKTGRIVLIDFGLSFTSHKVEDQAVDIHLFRQAFESTHNFFFKEAFDYFFLEYVNKINNPDEFKERFEIVQSRGRNKH